MNFSHLNGVMFDIETLGIEPGCIILSIGACRFNIEQRKIFDEFYVTIDILDSLKYGLVYENETLKWWKEQNEDFLRKTQENAKFAKEAYELFYGYLSKYVNEPLWAWGSHFDIPIVRKAMKNVLGIDKMPWNYYNVYDARTVSNVFGLKIRRDEKFHHDALEDSKVQAKFIIDLFSQ